MSHVLVVALLAFLAVASGVLVWEGLAAGVGHGRTLAARDLRRVRFRFTVGAIVLAIVLWIALGMITHAW